MSREQQRHFAGVACIAPFPKAVSVKADPEAEEGAPPELGDAGDAEEAEAGTAPRERETELAGFPVGKAAGAALAARTAATARAGRRRLPFPHGNGQLCRRRAG